jgi:hypothetical protein
MFSKKIKSQREPTIENEPTPRTHEEIIAMRKKMWCQFEEEELKNKKCDEQAIIRLQKKHDEHFTFNGITNLIPLSLPKTSGIFSKNRERITIIQPKNQTGIFGRKNQIMNHSSIK